MDKYIHIGVYTNFFFLQFDSITKTNGWREDKVISYYTEGTHLNLNEDEIKKNYSIIVSIRRLKSEVK